ncbi:MAG: hypothetical protein ACTHN5_10795 [Phycisphaerae bacterium]
MNKRFSVGMILAAAVACPTLATASESASETLVAQPAPDTAVLEAPNLSLQPSTDAPAKEQTTKSANDNLPAPVLELAPGTPSRLHGFGNFSINSQYITPRGLVALDRGPQFQAVVGLALDVYQGSGFINDISLNAGTWGDWNSHPSKSVVTGADIWSEEDFFGGFDVKFLNKWDFSYSIEAWTFPDISTADEINPTTEYNMEFKFGYDDSDLLKAFAVHPYVDFFWNFAGDSSPVVSQALLGKNDHTFYVEVGGAPSYTLKAIDSLPITFTMPTYISFGDSSFWGETPGPNGSRSNLGVFSTGLKASVPLSFIPQDFGNWNAFVGVTWIYTANPALSYVNDTLQGSGDTHNRVLGTAGVGFNF